MRKPKTCSRSTRSTTFGQPCPHAKLRRGRDLVISGIARLRQSAHRKHQETPRQLRRFWPICRRIRKHISSRDYVDAPERIIERDQQVLDGPIVRRCWLNSLVDFGCLAISASIPDLFFVADRRSQTQVSYLEESRTYNGTREIQ